MPPLATVGILSIGEMGMGVAKLLIAHNYRVITNIEGRRWGSSISFSPFSSDSWHLIIENRDTWFYCWWMTSS